MILRCYTLGYMSKDSHIMVRCDMRLRQRIEHIAAHQRRNLSDLARIILEDYASEQERELGLGKKPLVPPMSPAKAREILTKRPAPAKPRAKAA